MYFHKHISVLVPFFLAVGIDLKGLQTDAFYVMKIHQHKQDNL